MLMISINAKSTIFEVIPNLIDSLTFTMISPCRNLI